MQNHGAAKTIGQSFWCRKVSFSISFDVVNESSNYFESYSALKASCANYRVRN